MTGLVDDLHAAFRHAVALDRPLALRLAGDVHDYAYFRQRLDLLRWGSVIAEQGRRRGRAGFVAGTRHRRRRRLDGRADGRGRAARRACRRRRGRSRRTRRFQARKVCADLAMFANRTDEAVHRYRALAASWRAAGQPVPALLFEMAAAHSLLNGGRTGEAAEVVERLARRRGRNGEPDADVLGVSAHGARGRGREPGTGAHRLRRGGPARHRRRLPPVRQHGAGARGGGERTAGPGVGVRGHSRRRSTGGTGRAPRCCSGGP